MKHRRIPKQIFSALLIPALIIAAVPCFAAVSAESDCKKSPAYIMERDITDEQLAEKFKSGEIPHNVDFFLGISDNITTLTPFSELTNLWILLIGGDRITDLEPLSELPRLETFWFVGDNLTDISPLSKMTNLRELSLEGDKITDITPLIGLTNLEKMDLRHIPITPTQADALKTALPDCEIEHGARDVLSYAHIVGVLDYTVFDALEILKYIVNMDNIIEADADGYAREAAALTDESKESGELTVFDALEILKSLVGMPSKCDGVQQVPTYGNPIPLDKG